MYDIDVLKGYLDVLGFLKIYLRYLDNTGKKDNLRSIKEYFNRNIHISIIDFHNGNYGALYLNIEDFRRYMKEHPNKRSYKDQVKREKIYRVFLR